MSLERIKNSIDILVCEDNLGDVYLITNSLQNSTLECRLHHVNNGEAAIDYLEQFDPYQNASRPDLILLDLNLPKKHGLEVLEEIKTNPKFKTIPVIILTSSQSEQDIWQSYELHGNCFVTKPFDVEEFTNTIKKIENFWLDSAQLPPKSNPYS